MTESHDDPVAFYRKCSGWVENAGLGEKVEYFRNLRLADADLQFFFEQYVHVVLVSGFGYDRVQGLYKKGLWDALRGGKIEDICRHADEVRRQALLVFHHRGKVNGIVDTALRLAEMNWDELKLELAGRHALSLLRTFPYIGQETQYHLARNIGWDYPKPDRHMKRAAAQCGYPSTEGGVFDFVQVIVKATGERPGVIDYVIWEYMRR